MTRVGLIGFGYWGPNLARNIAETPGLSLTAVADARADRLDVVARRHPGTVRLTDARELIARADVDAVVVATPLSTHFALASESLEHDKHVLVEKPLASTAAECDGAGPTRREARTVPDGGSHVRVHRCGPEDEAID